MFSAHVTDTFGLCNDFANARSLCVPHSSAAAPFCQSSQQMSCSATLSICVLIALAFFFKHHLNAACTGQRAVASPVWVLLTAGGTLGHPLQLWKYKESLHLTMARAMRFYTIVPRFSADPRTHSTNIRWGLPRTGRRRFISGRRVRQKSSGVSRWLLIRSHANFSFSWTTSLVVLISPFPVPK